MINVRKMINDGDPSFGRFTDSDHKVVAIKKRVLQIGPDPTKSKVIELKLEDEERNVKILIKIGRDRDEKICVFYC